MPDMISRNFLTVWIAINEKLDPFLRAVIDNHNRHIRVSLFSDGIKRASGKASIILLSACSGIEFIEAAE